MRHAMEPLRQLQIFDWCLCGEKSDFKLNNPYFESPYIPHHYKNHLVKKKKKSKYCTTKLKLDHKNIVKRKKQKPNKKKTSKKKKVKTKISSKHGYDAGCMYFSFYKIQIQKKIKN